jgi:hypothetical protein
MPDDFLLLILWDEPADNLNLSDPPPERRRAREIHWAYFFLNRSWIFSRAFF